MAMSNLNDARERAEELLQNMQKRARSLWESDAVHGVRTFIDEKGLPRDARRVIDATVAKVKDSTVVQKLRRTEWEKAAGDSWRRLLETIPLASRAELAEVGKQVKTLNKKINELAKKFDERADN